MQRTRTGTIGGTRAGGAAGVAMALLLGLASAAAAQAPAAFPTLEARVPAGPAPVAGGGRTHLAYELHLANLSSRPTTIDAVDVRDAAAAAGAAPLLHLDEAAIERTMRRYGVAPDDPDKRLIAGGRVAVIFVWITLPAGAAAPKALTHRIATHVGEPPASGAAPTAASTASAPAAATASSPATGAATAPSAAASSSSSSSAAPPSASAASPSTPAGTAAGAATGATSGAASAAGPGAAVTIDGVTVAVAARAPRLIGPPLQGEHWLAANGPDNDSGHRRALVALDGDSHIAQRFAIDWVQFHPNGQTWQGDQSKNASYRCHGALALAVADATVSDTHDGIPENVPGIDSRAVPITPRTVGGNYVILDLGDGAFAFYAHLQPGSLKVKKGDKVRRGQPLGLVGNSGNSTEPHLHFHLSDRNSPLASEGLPYAFETFDLQVTAEALAKASDPKADTGPAEDAWAALVSKPAQVRRREMPMQNEIIRFPAR